MLTSVELCVPLITPQKVLMRYNLTFSVAMQKYIVPIDSKFNKLHLVPISLALSKCYEHSKLMAYSTSHC